MRATAIRGDRIYDRTDKLKLGPEYKGSESATQSKRRHGSGS